jgi:hypothetical protein
MARRAMQELKLNETRITSVATKRGLSEMKSSVVNKILHSLAERHVDHFFGFESATWIFIALTNTTDAVEAKNNNVTLLPLEVLN